MGTGAGRDAEKEGEEIRGRPFVMFSNIMNHQHYNTDKPQPGHLVTGDKSRCSHLRRQQWPAGYENGKVKALIPDPSGPHCSAKQGAR